MVNYTPNLLLPNPVPGEPSQTNVWGTTENTGRTLVDSATAGIQTLSVAGSSDVILTSSSGAPDQARHAHFVFTGVLTGNIKIFWPQNLTRIFSVKNSTTGAFTLILAVNNGSGVPAGTTYTLDQGLSASFVSDGTNISLRDTVVAAGGTAATINYTPPGTSAVTRTIANKFSELPTVQDFGAIPDGTTDNGAAFQAAMNYTQGWAIVPGGISPTTSNYKIATTVTYKSNGSHRRGGGIIGLAGTAENPNITVTAATGFIIGDNTFATYTWGFQLQNICFNGNLGAQTSDGIHFEYCAEMAWSDVIFKSFKGRGVRARACTDCHITNMRMQYNSYLVTTGALEINSDGGSQSSNHFKFVNCQFEGNFYSDIIINGIGGGGEDDHQFTNCKFGNTNYVWSSVFDPGQFHVQASNGTGLYMDVNCWMTTGGGIIFSNWNGYNLIGLSATNMSNGIWEYPSLCANGRIIGAIITGNNTSDPVTGSLSPTHYGMVLHSNNTYVSSTDVGQSFHAVRRYLIDARSDHVYMDDIMSGGEAMDITTIATEGTLTSVRAGMDSNRTIRSINQIAPISGTGMEMFYDTGTSAGWLVAINRSTSGLQQIRMLGNDYMVGSSGGFATGVTMANGANSWSPIASDARLKDDLGTIPPGLTDNLVPRYFRLKTDPEDFPPRLGFFAQDLQQDLSPLVIEKDDGYLTLLTSDPMAAVLVAEIQDLKRRLALVETKQ